jgi:serine/threonine protein kinase
MSESSAPLNSCPQCGVSLPSDATAGLCPRCILAQALQPPSPVAEDLTGLDVTVRVAAPVSSGTARQEVDLPLPEELTNLLPHGNYSVESFLGQGGMGAVYKGTQVRLKRSVAIKIMRRAMGKDYDFEQRFEREAQAMAKLNHPNIVSVIDYGEAGPDYLYIVMELVDGADLMDVIRGGQMTQEMALSLLPQICDALQFAHDHGIVHRDIKPSNIMLTRDGRIKMADFGLAKRFDAESSFRTQTGTGMGTPDYAAPEQFDPTSAIDHRADIYALGVMIYQMITGQLPRGVWKPPSQRAEVAPQWDAIVSRAMQSDPSDRYQQASEVKIDVEGVSKLVPPDATSATSPTNAPKGGAGGTNQEIRATSRSRTPLLVGLITGVVVLAVGAFFVLKRPAQSGPLSPLSGTNGANVPGPAQGTVRSASSKPGGIKLWDTADKIPVGAGITWEDGALRVDKVPAGYTAPAASGAILRASVRASATTEVFQLNLRNGTGSLPENRFYYGLNVDIVRGKISLRFFDGFKNERDLRDWKMPPSYRRNEWVKMELRVSDGEVTAFMDGELLGAVRDSALVDFTGFTLWANPHAHFRDIVYVPLDGGSAASVPSTIKLWDSPEKIKPKAGQWKDNALWLHGESSLWTSSPSRDATVRAHIRMNRDGVNPLLALRVRVSPGGEVSYAVLGVSTDFKALSFYTEVAGKRGKMTQFPLHRSYGEDEWLRVELRAVGTQFTAVADGEILGTVQDSSLPEPGGVQLFAKANGYFRDIEYVPLDTAVGTVLSASTEPWQNALAEEAGLALTGAVERTVEGLRLTGPCSANPGRSAPVHRDGAVRMLATYSGLSVQLRARLNAEGSVYAVNFRDADKVVLMRFDNTTKTTAQLRTFPLQRTLKPGQDYELELRVVGTTLTVKFNGEVLGTATDSTCAEGLFGVGVGAGAYGSEGPPALIKALEVLYFDSTSGPKSATTVIKANGVKPIPKWERVEWTQAELQKQDPTNPVRKEGNWYHLEKSTFFGPPEIERHSNLAIRFRFVMENNNWLQMHFGTPGMADAGHIFGVKPTEVNINYYDPALKAKQEVLFRGKLSQPLIAGTESVAVFAAISGKYMSLVNGERFGPCTDDRATAARKLMIQHMNLEGNDPGLRIKDIEVINLDGLPEAEALSLVGLDEKGNDLRGKTGTASAPASVSSPTPAIQTFAGHRYQFVPGNRSWTKARADAEALGGHLATITSKAEDDFVRVTFGTQIPKMEAGFWLGAYEEKPGSGWRWVTGEKFEFTAWGGGFPFTRSDMDQTSPTALFFQRHEHSPKGAWTNYEPSSPKHAIIIGFLMEWDDNGTASATPATATHTSPFTNTLGMQFVPVPITGGPTDKQPILFCVWETRVQDYEVFATETKREWKKPDFEQRPLNPAVNVSWDDAQAFCTWLTEREHKSNALAANQTYRLPTDHEWSCAIGIGAQEDAAKAPADKNGKLLDVFPWGTTWPPTKGAGNYAGEELLPMLANIKVPKIQNVIQGYQDNDITTSSVSAYPLNHSKIYDLGGNAREWCEDWFDSRKEGRVLRGASWSHADRNSLLSSTRQRGNQVHTDPSYGFRVVLAPVP